MFYPSTWDIISIGVMGFCASFFYLYGRQERSAGWPWALVSFGIWAVIYFVFQRGILWQVLGQVGLLGVLTAWGMLRPHRAKIVR